MMFRTCRDTVRTCVPDKGNKETAMKYYCEFCDVDSEDRVWDSEPDLEIHRRNVHKKELIHLLEDRNSFICTVCLQKQTDKAALIRHIKTHHLLSPPDATCVKRELFICDYCTKIFFNKQLLVVHILSLHLLSTEEKKKAMATCPSCFNKVSMKSIWFHFLHHGIIHTACCPICIKTFENTKEVLAHVESHSGYYNCAICLYETKKEYLFVNHLQKHKNRIDLTVKNDVTKITKYFVPRSRSVEFSGRFTNVFRGVKPDPLIKVCILCRAMCLSEKEMLQHIYGDHSPTDAIEVKRYLCRCGEEFSNNILLKHHIFTLKGDHKVFNGLREELDKLIEENSADWENCNSNSEPGLCIDVEMTDNDSVNNSNIPVHDTQQTTEDIIESNNDAHIFNDNPSNDSESNYEPINDTQDEQTNDTQDEQTNDTQHEQTNDTQDEQTNDTQDDQTNDMCIDYSSSDVIKSSNDTHRGCETVNDTSMPSTIENSQCMSSFETDNVIIHGHNGEESVESVDLSKGYYEQIVIIREDDIGMSESTEQIQCIPVDGQQFVFKVIVPADSTQEVGEVSSENH